MMDRCHYCGVTTVRTDKRVYNQHSIDHVIPRSRGGDNSKENRVACCISCNMSKGGRSIEEWRLALAKKRSGQPWFSQEQIAWLNRTGFEWPQLAEVTFFFEREEQAA